MDIKVATYRTEAFVAEKNLSSIAYEVKRTRAIFDDSLAIPGTSRRGGWRCPPGTRYGGQITDRFGRNCGWGVSRRLANEISDLGERLENVGDRRRGRRAARAAERAVRPGLVERAAGRVADVLDSGETVEPPKTPRARRGGVAPRRQARPNLRMSEERRMVREIENPNAPRTGEGNRPAAPSRPRPAQPRARRREAAVDVVERKPKPVVENVVPEAPVVEPAKVPAKKAVAKKKAAVKKAPAKKKTAVKKKAAVKKAAARRVTPAAGGEAEPPRLSTARPATPARPRVDSDNAANSERMREARADRARGAGQEVSLNRVLRDSSFNEYLMQTVIPNDRIMVINDARNFPTEPAQQRAKTREAEQKIIQANARIERIEQAISRGELSDNDFIKRGEEDINIARVKTYIKDYRDAWQEVLDMNSPDAPPGDGERPETPRAATPPRVETPAVPPINGLRDVFAGRSLGYERDFIAEKERIGRLANFDNVPENQVVSQIADIRQALTWNREYLENVSRLDANQRIQMPNRVAEAGDLKRQIEGVVNAWEERLADADRRLGQLNALRLPGMEGMRTYRNQVINGHEDITAARSELNRLITDNPGTRFNIVSHENRLYVVSQEQLNEIRLRGNSPRVREFRGGLPLANELPSVDSEVARKAEERVNDAIKKRQAVLATYLNQRYGEGNAPWKEMTPARYQELIRQVAQGDAGAKRDLEAWAKEMYSHPLINGQNGKTYRTVANARWNGSYISVSVQIERQNPNGSWENVGSSARTIGIDNPPSIYNNSMFINSAQDKNSGIQTIYNQHAFMYAKAAGFSHVDVSAVDDGRFVWGKIGFKQRLEPGQVSSINDEVAKFRAGMASLIDSESDARIVEHLVGKFIREPNSVRHIDFVTAITNTKVGAPKKTRDKAIKDWFTNNMVFRGGRFSLDENKIVADPRD